MTVWKSTIWTGTEIITDGIISPYSIGIATTRFMRCVGDNHQTVEEPCEGKAFMHGFVDQQGWVTALLSLTTLSIGN
jgi:hypothetical protein